MLRNIRMFLLHLSSMLCTYTHLVFCTSIHFSNTLVTVRNKSRQILAYLMHFFSSSHYIMKQAFCSLSHPHILVSIFSIASWFFQQHFFSVPTTCRLFSSFRLLHFVPGFLQWFLQQFFGLCHVSHSSILSLCICYLTTKMLTFCTYEI